MEINTVLLQNLHIKQILALTKVNNLKCSYIDLRKVTSSSVNITFRRSNNYIFTEAKSLITILYVFSFLNNRSKQSD